MYDICQKTRNKYTDCPIDVSMERNAWIDNKNTLEHKYILIYYILNKEINHRLKDEKQFTQI